METLRTVIFDFDGTLIDSAPDLTHAANQLMKELGEAEFRVETIAGFIGNGIPKLVERVMRAREIRANRHSQLTRRFIALYEQDPTSKTVVFEGVFEALDTLQSRNIQIAICTNKAERAARMIVDGLKFSPYVNVLIGGDTTPHLKPNPAPILEAMKHLKASPKTTLFVGDSPIDAEAAKRANLPFALYTGGYSHGQLASIKAEFRFSDYHEFIASLSALTQ